MSTSETRVFVDGKLVIVNTDKGLKVNATKPAVQVVRQVQGVSLFGVRTHHFKAIDLLDRIQSETGGAGVIVAPMPGAVKDVMAKVGDKVEKGETLLILEAMKMEHRLVAPFDGVVAELNVVTGGQVSDGAVLATVEEAEV